MEDFLKILAPLIFVLVASMANRKQRTPEKRAAELRRKRKFRDARTSLEPSAEEPVPSASGEKRPTLAEWIQELQEKETGPVPSSPTVQEEPVFETEFDEPVVLQTPEPVATVPAEPDRDPSDRLEPAAYEGGRGRSTQRMKWEAPTQSTDETLTWQDMDRVDAEEAVDGAKQAHDSLSRRGHDSVRMDKGPGRIRLRRGDLRMAMVLREVMGPPKGLP